MWTPSRSEIEQHSVDMRQFIDFRQSTLDNGMRIIEAYNSSGLTFNILPDRGLDIWLAHYNGIAFTWSAQGAPYPPDMGQPWLRQFNGGLLATCGLTHVGPPETDDNTGQFRDLHGLYSRLRATNVSVSRQWRDDNTYAVELHGTVCEAMLFSEQLRLERTYTLTLGDPTIKIFDRITNVGDIPTPLMVLYHFNVGYPLVREGTRFEPAYDRVLPREEVARAGLNTWQVYHAASPNYAEQVFFHHVKAGDDGMTEALISRDDLGLAFRWDTRALPYLTQWKNTRRGVYVSGIEPGNCIPEGRNAARSSGRLDMIEPGDSREYAASVTVLDDAGAIRDCQKRIHTLRHSGQPVAGCNLGDLEG